MASKQKKPAEFTELPVLPVRDTVLFPNAILPLTVGREGSLKLIGDLKEEEKFIAVVAQRDPRIDNPQPVDLYQIGTAAFIHKIIRLPSHPNECPRVQVRRFHATPLFLASSSLGSAASALPE